MMIATCDFCYFTFLTYSITMTKTSRMLLPAVLVSMLPTTAFAAQTLAEAVELVVNKHPQILRATADWYESRERIDVAKAA